MTTTVFNVANHILKRDKRFDLLQLIKLCYLSYGWYLAYHGDALFREKIEAWRYGPVIPELYYALKHKGKPLPPNCLEGLADDNDHEFSDDMKELVNAVVGYYGRYKGVELSALTHKKGSPWDKIYKGEKFSWVVIPKDVIKDHFDELRAKARG